jgi:hypothetical protein
MMRPTFELVGSVLKIKMSHKVPNEPSEEILSTMPQTFATMFAGKTHA